MYVKHGIVFALKVILKIFCNANFKLPLKIPFEGSSCPARLFVALREWVEVGNFEDVLVQRGRFVSCPPLAWMLKSQEKSQLLRFQIAMESRDLKLQSASESQPKSPLNLLRSRVNIATNIVVSNPFNFRGQKKHINIFNINFPPDKTPDFGPTEKSFCASFPGKERKQGTHINFSGGIFGSNWRPQTGHFRPQKV